MASDTGEMNAPVDETGGRDAGSAVADDGGERDSNAPDANSGQTPAPVENERDCSGLPAVVRDFSSSHADFEAYWGSGATTGIVQSTLGADGKPQLTGDYLGAPSEGTQVSSETTFAHWYADVDGVNTRLELELPLTEVSAGRFVFDSADASNPFGGVSGFFPVDDLAGAELSTVQGLQPDPSASQTHNFHFTTELHATFVYRGGEVFTFSGDDDVWVFANGQLALDLGGLHGRVEGTIDFDAQADALGLTAGETYALDVFHAERRTNESNFRIETSIDCFTPVVIQ